MLDAVHIVDRAPGSPLGIDNVGALLEAHDWDALPDSPYARQLLGDDENPTTERALTCLHTTIALRQLWPAAEDRFGLTGATHAPDEINLVATGRGIALRFWWRWGGDLDGCPSGGGQFAEQTVQELARRLP